MSEAKPSNLVVRLREWAQAPMYAMIRRQLTEAADEIERLNKIADDLAALAKRHIAEKAKLRAALSRIADHSVDPLAAADANTALRGGVETTAAPTKQAQRDFCPTCGAERVCDTCDGLGYIRPEGSIIGVPCPACLPVKTSGEQP